MRGNYLRFRLGPDRVAIALGARVKNAGEAMAGREIELFACNSQADEMTPYDRLVGALDGAKIAGAEILGLMTEPPKTAEALPAEPPAP